MDWAAAKREYITTGATQKTLAQKYGISYSHLRQVASAERWTDQRNKYLSKAEHKTLEKTSDAAAEARALLYQGAVEMIRQLNELAAGRDWSNLKPRDVTAAMKDCRDILDLKSDADIEEQKARIAKLRKEAEVESDKNREITVRFEEFGEWAK